MRSLMCSLLLVGILLFHADAGHACTCAPAQSAARELARATAVFSGKVVEIKRHKRPADVFAGVEVRFRVEKVWKGAGGGVVSVFTSSHSAACGYAFRKGRTYLVYAHGDGEGRLSTSICSRTKRLKDAREDLGELGAGKDTAAGVSNGVRRPAGRS